MPVQVILLVRMWVEKPDEKTNTKARWVILLVRMWVEKAIVSLLGGDGKSSSLWGCELKNRIRIRTQRLNCHPPCEDVSWKIHKNIIRKKWGVILLVRMWVEKTPSSTDNAQRVVILLVRMWVEKHTLFRLSPLSRRHPPCEDVSWKSRNSTRSLVWSRHPPCEDVSWKEEAINILTEQIVILLVRMWVEKTAWCSYPTIRIVILLVRMWVEKTAWCSYPTIRIVILLVRMWVEKVKQLASMSPSVSSSLWGCELKNFSTHDGREESKSSSLWGCELKNREKQQAYRNQSHPPCEDVSWKEHGRREKR